MAVKDSPVIAPTFLTWRLARMNNECSPKRVCLRSDLNVFEFLILQGRGKRGLAARGQVRNRHVLPGQGASCRE